MERSNDSTAARQAPDSYRGKKFVKSKAHPTVFEQVLRPEQNRFPSAANAWSAQTVCLRTAPGAPALRSRPTAENYYYQKQIQGKTPLVGGAERR